jgi:hypothetical protein
MIKSAEPRADSLANLVHSLGAARVASLFAVLLAFVIVYRVSQYSSETRDEVSFIITTLFAVIFLLAHHFAYLKTNCAAQRVVGQILTDALVEEACVGPVIAHVVLSDKKQRVHLTKPR